MSTYDPEGRDPGLAAERTDLAWNRSGLSLLACGTAIVRGIGRVPLASANTAAGVAVLALGAVTWGLGAWHASRSRRRGTRPTTAGDLLPTALGVSAVGVVALLVAILSPS
jgi:uncharacterized membrane protein YidH (DUF202 family)